MVTSGTYTGTVFRHTSATNTRAGLGAVLSKRSTRTHFITSRSSPSRLTKTLPCHVVTKCTIYAITFPLTLFTKVTSFTRLQTRTSLVPWGANALPSGLIARSVAVVTHWTGLTTAGTGLVAKQSLPTSITSTVSKYWMARSVNTRTRL